MINKREKNPAESEVPRLILSLKGGGVRVIFQARLLDHLRRNSVYEDSCLVAGTSTGAIVAIALGLNKTPKEIFNFYEKLGSTVFSKRRGSLAICNGKSKYSADILKECLEKEVFANQEVPFGECEKRTLVVATDVNMKSRYVFDSHKNKHKTITCVDVLLASCAAPPFFSPHVVKIQDIERLFMDGGLVANDPAAIALETVLKKNADREKTFVCSLGNGCHQQIETSNAEIYRNNFSKWMKDAFTCCIDGNVDYSNYFCSKEIGDNFLELDFDPGCEIELDNYTLASEKLPIAADQCYEQDQEVISDWKQRYDSLM